MDSESETGTAGALPAIVGRLPSWLLTQAAVHAQRLVSDRLGAMGAHRSDYRVLAALEEIGPMSQAALGRRSGIHLSDLVATLNQLAAAGFVERALDPTDRRRNVVSVTSDGRRQLRRLAKQVAQIQDELLAPLSAAEREQLTTLLTRVVTHHISDEA